MRLKKIKLAGFKSFVDPTSIPFPGDMTAIVGPNGCGKSNVIDAVRWVLGESSAKNLRGDAMTDVIFNGSSARKPVGQCSVELVFDNSAGRLIGEYANYNELSVKRIVTRDATSTYMLNGTKCRRRDVTDLFLGTGLGPRSYAIIEQGMISRLIESKPQDLRVFIEEAAGVSKYKERRRETENRIRHTEDNLDRLEDVRGELGQQIEKLQRQAAAAKRYTVLKASERELKSQLCAIRWLKHTHHIETIEKEMAEHQAELDALSAQQAGDEAGMMVYQSQLQAFRAEQEQTQQSLFTLSNQITRLEQNKQHSQQRRKQIAIELAQSDDKISALSQEAALLASQQTELQTHIETLEPQCELIEEKLWQAQQNRTQAEMTLAEKQASSRELELAHNTTKQEIQNCHSQVQSTMTMQMRTTQRIDELKQEYTELSDDKEDDYIEQLERQLQESEDAWNDAKSQVELAKVQLVEQRERVEEADIVKRQIEQEQQTAVSTLAALNALQASAHGVSHIKGEPLWQALDVKPGFESSVDTVLSRIPVPIVVDAIANVTAQDSLNTHGADVYIEQWMTNNKRKGSLAEVVRAERVPSVFNAILLVDSFNEALENRSTLQAGECYLAHDGAMIGPDWVMRGEIDEQSRVVQRETDIAELNASLRDIEARLEQQSQSVILAKDARQSSETKLETLTQHANESHAQYQQLTQSLALAKNQREQNQLKYTRVSEELARQQALLDSEMQQLEELSTRLEILEARQFEQESAALESIESKEALERNLATEKAAVERLTTDKHDLALTLQQQQSQYALLVEKLSQCQSALEDLTARQMTLNEENQTLSQPHALQEAELQQLLEQRQLAEEQKQQTLIKINEIEALISDAQKGQQGLISQLQQRQNKVDSCKIDLEGARVRAMSTLELLEETGDSLKSVLETLPTDADESIWQKELEKTTGAIGRLGAVNLAAVEEYDVQSERKAHLDAQLEDLETALETLRSAIRKIDKETRTRFSDTFEQVNSDLKMLFPKVFGGGSAYLALTDDDLLETGVTIMARPPGKKNSTIHLLSGGEKALTALSLVFAIFRLNPAPFCLLDEVDAPLDDANVGRFCNLVSEMSKSVQFIYITHNKIAMEMASHLTGVTMAEPGVSRMVAVDVEQAISFAEA